LALPPPCLTSTPLATPPRRPARITCFKHRHHAPPRVPRPPPVTQTPPRHHLPSQHHHNVRRALLHRAPDRYIHARCSWRGLAASFHWCYSCPTMFHAPFCVCTCSRQQGRRLARHVSIAALLLHPMRTTCLMTVTKAPRVERSVTMKTLTPPLSLLPHRAPITRFGAGSR
jgi:hypothetical protein